MTLEEEQSQQMSQMRQIRGLVDNFPCRHFLDKQNWNMALMLSPVHN